MSFKRVYEHSYSAYATLLICFRLSSIDSEQTNNWGLGSFIVGLNDILQIDVILLLPILVIYVHEFVVLKFRHYNPLPLVLTAIDSSAYIAYRYSRPKGNYYYRYNYYELKAYFIIALSAILLCVWIIRKLRITDSANQR